ncbi:Anti-sigma-B factor antagonist [Roseovarius litorisediminis]|uniref:Anti-sigma factor antagonist n=1 Tax=Roseovarius litorisediminis TaxID=1312363 RepID=A0A1Y5S1M8_9RHOB|nr:STAS domain-containing protein [Roseovarius litorisediminis]SLN29162.1 Anti-sigma-B factor antagonist [Roseovarius litorisediminis]
MDLQSTYHNNLNIITVKDARIDASVAIRFKDAMRAATNEGPPLVVLNLGNVTFVDSSGLGAIIASMKQLDSNRKLDLACLTPDVAKVFRLTRMDSIFDIHENIESLKCRAAG